MLPFVHPYTYPPCMLRLPPIVRVLLFPCMSNWKLEEPVEIRVKSPLMFCMEAFRSNSVFWPVQFQVRFLKVWLRDAGSVLVMPVISHVEPVLHVAEGSVPPFIACSKTPPDDTPQKKEEVVIVPPSRLNLPPVEMVINEPPPCVIVPVFRRMPVPVTEVPVLALSASVALMSSVPSTVRSIPAPFAIVKEPLLTISCPPVLI